MEFTSGVHSGQRVIVIGGEGKGEDQSGASSSQLLVEQLRQSVGQSELVDVQSINVDLMNSKVQSVTFDHCYLVSDQRSTTDLTTQITAPLLAQALRVLKLGGTLHVVEGVASGEGESRAALGSALRLAGFVEVTSSTKSVDNSLLHCCTVAKKPSYETGTSLPLKLHTAPAATTVHKGGVVTASKVWTLSANDDDDELIDSDTVLDESDFKKPDPSSLRAACGDGETKRKACKDCTCGLAEKLSSTPSTTSGPAVKLDSTVDPLIKPSSCGSCYLGDAFRCAGCPYLGMPAFKPGERVLLSDTKLQADI